jgi:hypothetical protein
MQPNPLFSAVPELRTQMKNPISFEIPKLIFDECFLISDNQSKTFKKLGRYDSSFSELGLETHLKFFNIFNTNAIYQGSYQSEQNSSIYSALHLAAKGN